MNKNFIIITVMLSVLTKETTILSSNSQKKALLLQRLRQKIEDRGLVDVPLNTPEGTYYFNSIYKYFYYWIKKNNFTEIFNGACKEMLNNTEIKNEIFHLIALALNTDIQYEGFISFHASILNRIIEQHPKIFLPENKTFKVHLQAEIKDTKVKDTVEKGPLNFLSEVFEIRKKAINDNSMLYPKFDPKKNAADRKYVLRLIELSNNAKDIEGEAVSNLNLKLLLEESDFFRTKKLSQKKSDRHTSVDDAFMLLNCSQAPTKETLPKQLQPLFINLSRIIFDTATDSKGLAGKIVETVNQFEEKEEYQIEEKNMNILYQELFKKLTID